MSNQQSPWTKENLTDKVLTGDNLTLVKSFPEAFVDLTITSPPYNKRNKSSGWLVTNMKYHDFDDHLPEDEYQAKQIEILNELLRVTKPGGSLFYNHKIRWVKGLMIHPLTWLAKTSWCIKQEIVWDRLLAANMRGWRFWQTDERVYWLYKPIGKDLIGRELLSKHAKASAIWRMRPEPRKENHPAPFPLDLPVKIIASLLPEEKGLVFDPYCGTGTTLVGAKLLGHNYLGIDQSTEYTALTNERLLASELERQTPLWHAKREGL
jgi:site-specific DNA-methyltransferase (adenine-specific)